MGLFSKKQGNTPPAPPFKKEPLSRAALDNYVRQFSKEDPTTISYTCANGDIVRYSPGTAIRLYKWYKPIKLFSRANISNS